MSQYLTRYVFLDAADEMDRERAESMAERVRQTPRGCHLVVDLSGVTRFDPLGIGSLLASLAAMRGNLSWLHIIGLSSRMAHVFSAIHPPAARWIFAAGSPGPGMDTPQAHAMPAGNLSRTLGIY